MRINNQKLCYYIILICTVLFYISFNKNSLRTVCLFFCCILIILNAKNKAMVDVLPSLTMAVVTLLMLAMSGRMAERGFNAPIVNEAKFVYILFVQCVAIIMSLIDRQKKKIILLTTFGTIAVSCLVSIFYAATQDIYAIRYFEEKGFKNVMDFDQSYAVPFAFALILFLLINAKWKELKRKMLPIAFLILSAYFAFVSLYTTALIFIALAIVICFLFTLYRKSKKLFVVLMLIGVSVLIVVIFFNQQISDFLYDLTEGMNWIVRARVRSVIDTVFRTDHRNWYNTNRRNELAGFSLETFKQHPLFGVGYRGYRYGVIGCHQEWYDMLGVFGLIGGGCILFVMLFYVRRLYVNAETQMDKDALLISVVMLMVLGFLNPCLSKQVLFLVFVIAPNLSSLLPGKTFPG